MFFSLKVVNIYWILSYTIISEYLKYGTMQNSQRPDLVIANAHSTKTLTQNQRYVINKIMYYIVCLLLVLITFHYFKSFFCAKPFLNCFNKRGDIFSAHLNFYLQIVTLMWYKWENKSSVNCSNFNCTLLVRNCTVLL